MVLIGTAFVAVLSEVPQFEREVVVIVEKMVEFGRLEIGRIKIAKGFVGANRFDKRGRVYGREAEFVFDGLGTSFGIGLGCDTGEEVGVGMAFRRNGRRIFFRAGRSDNDDGVVGTRNLFDELGEKCSRVGVLSRENVHIFLTYVNKF